jgi:Na+-transporting methylmalonyl-CoA/oxaloacetate decarboxylase gamma subunit
MPQWLVDALYYALIGIAALFAFDILLLLFMWRVSVYRRNIARREKAQAFKHNDDWFSMNAQKELYRDFTG